MFINSQYHKELMRKYRQRPEVKEQIRKYRREYDKRPEVKEQIKKYQREYHQRPEVKERRKKSAGGKQNEEISQ